MHAQTRVALITRLYGGGALLIIKDWIALCCELRLRCQIQREEERDAEQNEQRNEKKKKKRYIQNGTAEQRIITIWNWRQRGNKTTSTEFGASGTDEHSIKINRNEYGV